MDEQTLSELCRQGNNLARQELYEKYAGRLFGLCLRYVSDRDTARDVLHDGFLKIFQSFDKFQWQGDGSLRAWIEKVMINNALQCLRKNKTASIYNVPLDDVHDLYEEPSPETIDRIPEKILMKFISELPEGYRTVFNLYVIEGKSHKEIAQLLHINEKSSASQLCRAKNTLAKRINEWIKYNS